MLLPLLQVQPIEPVQLEGVLGILWASDNEDVRLLSHANLIANAGLRKKEGAMHAQQQRSSHMLVSHTHTHA